MSAQSFEITLARLYTDPEFRQAFIRDAHTTLQNCDLTEDEVRDMMAIDRTGLLMAANSFLHKRKKRKKPNWFRQIGSRIGLRIRQAIN
jgi:hypothetical protein